MGEKIKMNFSDLSNFEKIYLYAGDIPPHTQFKNEISFIGLSLTRNDDFHINHDLMHKMDLPENCVDVYQSEDVMEHIEYRHLPFIINEVYRVLKPGGVFRLSMPDYRCDILYNRSINDELGNIIFDPGGGGSYDYKNKKVLHGGHVWFPKYETTLKLLQNTQFEDDKISFLHYYDVDGVPVVEEIDYKYGDVARTPDHDERVQSPRRPMSIVVDCFK
jgi:SAM-dependent methyltransferase